MAFKAGSDLIADDLNAAVGATWTLYTPTWTGATTNPVLGNGTLSGAWTKHGKTITVRVNLKPGSTTTYGSGAWRFALPETAATVAGFVGFPIWVGSAYGFDAGVANRGGDVNVFSGATYATITGNGTTSEWDATKPHTWSNGDYLSATFSYEAATF
jgi:hypothetical protein